MAPPLPHIYLNGEVVPLADARISVLDRGFLFGDGVYEVIPVFGGQPLRLDEHVARLDRSLDVTDMPALSGIASWQKLVRRMVGLNGGGDMSVYIQVTRGVGPDRDHRFPSGTPPTVLVMCQPAPGRLPGIDTEGIAAIVCHDPRWARCDIKATSLLANVLMRQQAADEDAAEAIMVKDGLVTEGAASSVFIYDGSTLKTPPNSPLILPGITRDLVIELAKADGIPIRIEAFTPDEMRVANEVMLASSVREIVPVCRIDGVAVGGGAPGPVWSRIDARYQAFKQTLRESAA